MAQNHISVNSTPASEPEEECTTWEKPTTVVGDEKKPLLHTTKNEEAGGEEVVDRRGLIMSFIILLLSIPALIGAWCWPALVIGLLSGAVTAAARSLGHYISFGVTLTMMIGINIYIAYKSQNRKRPHWVKYGPLYFTLIAALLVMADLTRHVLQDLNVWKSGPFPGSSQYRDGCNEETIKCLSVVGVFFTIIATYLGFIFLFIGTMWNANILVKLKQIRKQWQLLRAQAKKV